MRWWILVLAFVSSGCAVPFGDGCGGPSLLGSRGFDLFSGDSNAVVVRLRAGSTVSIPVCAVRYRFFADPIDVEVSGLPSGVRSKDALIAKGRYSTTLVLSSDPGARVPLRRLRVTGKAGSYQDEFDVWIGEDAVEGP